MKMAQHHEVEEGGVLLLDDAADLHMLSAAHCPGDDVVHLLLSEDGRAIVVREEAVHRNDELEHPHDLAGGG